MENEIAIKAEFLFEFTSRNQWINKAASWFKPYYYEVTVCIDKDGYVLHIGEDFRITEENDNYPVKVYSLTRVAARAAIQSPKKQGE